MSVKLMNQVFESTLPTTRRIVMLALADCGSDHGDSIYPSVETLSHKTGLAERTIQDTLHTLAGEGVIEIAYRVGRNNTNYYTISLDALAGLHDGYFRKGADGAVKGAGDAPNPYLTIHNHIPETQTVSDSGEKISEPLYVLCNDDGEIINSKNKKKKTKSAKVEIPEEKMNHPAIIAFREITGKNPYANQFDTVIKAIGSKPDRRRLHECYKEWAIVKHYRISNISWITDWYVNGIPGKQFQSTKEHKWTEEY